jgi:putative NADH-flavin reductase
LRKDSKARSLYLDKKVKLVNNPNHDYDYSNPSKRARNYLRDNN